MKPHTRLANTVRQLSPRESSRWANAARRAVRFPLQWKQSIARSWGRAYARLDEQVKPWRTKRFYRSFLSPGDLCFDIGANIGDRTEIFQNLGCRVVAVEPQPECAEILRDRFKRSNSVVVVEAGIADTGGFRNLSICPSHRGIATMSDEWRDIRFPDMNWEQPIVVPVSTLDALIERFGIPRFCKIDVEGFEGQVLRGLTQPIPVTSFEFTGLFLSHARSHLDHLSKLGPIEVNCSLFETMKFLLPRWVKPAELMDLLSSLAEDDPILSGDIYVVPAESGTQA